MELIVKNQSSEESPAVLVQQPLDLSLKMPKDTKSSTCENLKIIQRKLIQKQLLLIFHAAKCTKETTTPVFESDQDQISENHQLCKIVHCSTMKAVLTHLMTNSCGENSNNGEGEDREQINKNCNFPYCTSTRRILVHWKNCAGALGEKCLICSPIRKLDEISKKLKAIKRKSTSGSVENEITVEVKDPKRQCLTPKTPNFGIPPPASSQNEVWNGKLTWLKRTSADSTAVEEKDLKCQIFANAHAKNADKENSDWPAIGKLQLKLIPTRLLSKLGENMNTKNFQVVQLKFEEEDQMITQELKNMMKSGNYIGYVNIVHKGPPPTTDLKKKPNLFILHYNTRLEKFMGFIPNNPREFITRFFRIVREEILRIHQERDGVGGPAAAAVNLHFPHNTVGISPNDSRTL